MPNDNIDPDKLPPLAFEELEGAHAYDDLARVVVTQNGIYARREGSGWFRLQPIAEVTTRKA